MIEKPIFFKNEEGLPKGVPVVDAYSFSLRELFEIRNPDSKRLSPEEKDKRSSQFKKEITIDPLWIFFPWRNLVVKLVPEDIYYELRTARNKKLITKDEQEKFRKLVIGVAGLSVGSAIISNLVCSGGPKKIKIADFDVLETTNLNRIYAGVPELGLPKLQIMAQRIWEVDPFAEVELFEKGVNPNNIKEFIDGLDVMIDEMDMINMKVVTRHLCKENKIPVLMASDNGDSVLLDVERFDLEPTRDIFHGLVNDVDVSNLDPNDFFVWLDMSAKIIGPEYLPERMQDSVLSIGKEITSVPQLGATANMAGAAMSYIIRSIANNKTMNSGRYVISLEHTLIDDFFSPEKVEKRKNKTQLFKENFGKPRL